MFRYLLSRFGQFCLVVLMAVSLNFTIPRLIPGDPVELALGRLQQSSGGEGLDVNSIAEEYRKKYGLDRPVLQQYFSYWSDILRGDLGRSLSTLDQPVTEKIGNALPWTIGLLGTSVLLAFVLGTALGAVLSWPRFSRFAMVVGAPFLLTVAIPQYLLAVILVAIFSVMLRWLPAAGGMSTITIAGFNWNTISDILRHAVLPASALVLGTVGFWAMGMRANMISVLGNDYMTFAEAKGLHERTIFARYGVRNALLPQITSLALAVSTIVSGAILVEIVFNYPGLGGLLYSAISTKDYFVIQGITLILVIATATALFVLDLVYPLIDPRVRNQ